MMHPADLPETVSVFPLPGALLLPRSRLPLHIFEPRYLQMLDDALKTPERLIGMIQPNPCQSNESKLHQIGCAGRVTQFSETEDGRYLITLSGVSRFRIKSELDAFTPYRRCAVSWDGFDRDLGKAEADNAFDLSMLLDFDPEEKQALLEAPCLRTRRETLVTLIEFAMRGGSSEEKLQ